MPNKRAPSRMSMEKKENKANTSALVCHEHGSSSIRFLVFVAVVVVISAAAAVAVA